MSRRTARPRLLLIALCCLILSPTAVWPTSASAVTVEPMTEVYRETVNGNYQLVGNGVSVCEGSATCSDLHSGVAGSNNNSYQMGWADTDTDDGTYNSTFSTVSVPAGAQVVKAVLYWSGQTGVTRLNNGSMVSNRCVPDDTSGVINFPSGEPEEQAVRMTVAGQQPIDVVPSSVHSETEAQLTAGNPQYYSADADVTDQLAALPSGSDQTITVGNVWTPEPAGVTGAGRWRSCTTSASTSRAMPRRSPGKYTSTKATSAIRPVTPSRRRSTSKT